MATEFWNKYYKSLEGARIVKFLGMIEDEFGLDPFPAFLVQLSDGETVQVEVSRDPEGNGGGFLFGLPMPQKVGA